MSRKVIMFVIGILAMLLLLHPATAVNYDEKKNFRLEEDEYYEMYMTGLKSGDKIDITVEVEEGGNIDIMLMDTVNFASFKSAISTGEGSWVSYTSEKNTKYATITMNAPEDGDYILVVDNSDQPASGADPEGFVDVNIDVKVSGSDDSSVCCFSPAILAACLLLTIVLFGIYIKKH